MALGRGEVGLLSRVDTQLRKLIALAGGMASRPANLRLHVTVNNRPALAAQLLGHNCSFGLVLYLLVVRCQFPEVATKAGGRDE